MYLIKGEKEIQPLIKALKAKPALAPITESYMMRNEELEQKCHDLKTKCEHTNEVFLYEYMIYFIK